MRFSLAMLAAAAAVEASPFAFPGGVTSKIAPSQSAPSGCLPDYSGTFGIAVMNVTATSKGAATVSTQADGQPTAGTAAPVSEISDGQPQQPTTTVVAPVTQISDGQIQATTKTMMGVSQIGDGQIQAATKTYAAVSQISDGQIQATTVHAVSQISDGQIQATTTNGAVSQISDGQIQASTKSAVSELSDGQPQATGTAATQASDGQAAQATGSSSTAMVACKSNSTLEITLSKGVLVDSKGRTGYIASNFQFQFDDPPQAGAIYTAGWSVCSNGSLALGGSSIFYQCLSGDFYNLYNEDWAAQCNAVTINALELITCSA